MAEVESLVLEFSSENDCLEALVALKRAGYTRLSAHTPVPSKRIERALGLRESILPFLTFAAGMTGAGAAYVVQWWTQAVDYPLNVGSHPTHGPLAFVAITFASGILCAGLMAFIGCLVLCGLPRWWHPLFEIEAFRRSSIDRYFLILSALDPQFDPESTRTDAEKLEPLRVVVVGGGKA